MTGHQPPPSFNLYTIPPGAFVCPGQIITPTGCQPLDGSGSVAGATPTPSWSWGPVPSGAPVFPVTGTSGGGTTDPQAPIGGAPAGAVTRGAVEAAVDILGPFTQPSGLPATPGAPTFGSSVSPAFGSGASPSGPGTTPGAPSAGMGSDGAAASPAPSGDVAAATGMAQDGSLPPGPAPTASITTPSPPALPLVLAVVLLALLGASVAAAVGWARRGFWRGIARPIRTIDAADGSLAAAIRRVRRWLGRETGVQS